MRTWLMPLIIISIILFIEIYTYKALKSRWSFYSKRWKSILKYGHLTLMVLSIIGVLALFLIGRNFPSWLLNFFFGFVIINLISKFLFTLILLVDDIIRLTKWIKQKTTKKIAVENDSEGISRLDFMVKSGAIVAAVPVASLTTGMLVGPYKYTLHQPKVSLPQLPSAFEGLKIVQISDIHAGSFYNKKAVNKGIDLLLAQKPDIIFFTGDLVNDSAKEMDNYMDVFSRLKAPLGVFSILGNHDYGDYKQWKNDEEKAANLARLKTIHSEMGWRLLLDEHVYIEKDGEKIGLIGVQNWGGRVSSRRGHGQSSKRL